jgi:Xaa-Pro aminopeptidase
MEANFSPNFFKGNRERLRKLFVGTAPIVLTANGLLQRATTEPFVFQQDSNFWYLTGINEPDILLVMDKGKEYLILPKRSDYLDIFTGAQLADKLKELSGVDEVLDNKEGLRRLKSKIKKSKHAATLAAPTSYIDVYGMYANPARANLVEMLKSFNSNIKLLDLRPHLAQLRMVKQAIEMDAIKQAIKITESSLNQLSKRGWQNFASTFDIETKLLSLFRQKGSDEPGFDSVIAAGQDTCVIHSRPNRNRLPAKGAILLDVGARFNMYCADISRTYFLRPPNARQQKIYGAVEQVHDYARNLLKPGVLIKDYEKQIEHFMGEKLRSLGLIKSIERTTVRKYFPHATSHHLGIDVHDVADYEKPLSAGMVLTVEPGIYIPEEGVGVRIEDDVVITEKSNKLLTKKARPLTVVK